MSQIYDNWERLVAAVLRKEELWQLCHENSRNPTTCSDQSSDFSSTWSSLPVENLTFRHDQEDPSVSAASNVWALSEKQYKPGVYITLAALPDGTRFVKRVRFSQIGFEEQQQAVIWWFKNREIVYSRYNALGGIARIRRPSVVTFSSSPLTDHYDGKEEKESLSVPVSSDHEHQASRTRGNEEIFSDLLENEKIALQELKQLVQEALNKHEFSSYSPKADDGTQEIPRDRKLSGDGKAPDEVFIWGVKLMENEKTNAVLMKFLRARDFKVKDAFTMIKNTVKWRKEFGIDELVEEDLGKELERVVFMHGHSKEGHPVCYNVYGEFQNKDLYQIMFSDEEKRLNFLRWSIQFLEKSIRKLDFSPGGVSTIVQVNDLKNSPGPNRWELRQATNQALQLLHDYYPEFVAKQVFINAPRWYLAFNKIISPLLTSRTKSKFAFAGPSLSMATRFKYTSTEKIPKQYHGLSKDGEFITADNVTEIVVKPSGLHIEEFPVTQACLVKWEVRVVGWEASYSAEFVPSTQYQSKIIIEKLRRIGSTQEQVICGSYKVDEPGKLVLTISGSDMTQRTKSKFVVSGPSTSTDTLFKYISPEQIPTQYGGLSKEDGDFGIDDHVNEIIVKPTSKHIVEFPITQVLTHKKIEFQAITKLTLMLYAYQACKMSWEARVLGWEVSYGAEFVPSDEDAYTYIVHKTRRIGSTEEQVICGSFKVGEPGKLVLIIDNLTSKKKKLLYRFKTNLSHN